MRPTLLNPLFASTDTLPGVGPKVAARFERLLGEGPKGARILDLLFHLPYAVIDRSARPPLNEAPTGTIVTLKLLVEDHSPGPGGRSKTPYRVLCSDETGDVTLIFFGGTSQRLEKLLPVGQTRWVSGKLETWDGRLQMVHPDRIFDEAASLTMAAFEPVYGLTEGLHASVLGRAVAAALARLPSLPEWQDAAWLARNKLPSLADALATLHRPGSADDVAPLSPARKRLAYDEVLASQLALLLVRQGMKKAAGRAMVGDGHISARILEALPFSLTGSQERAIEEIKRDLASPERMLRLLQGDVGSGKTMVALLALASVVEAGHQGALMAPTEILARQHYGRLKPLAESAGLRVALLTGREKGAAREKILTGIAAGEVDIAFGTHALFQEGVVFGDLGLAVVDEQHRFGVHQRLALSRKGEAVDVLVMTATPIPRTLVLSYFGDMDVSVLRDKPPGRQPIDTRAVSLDRLGDVVAAIGRALDSGARVYWVCPLVDEVRGIGRGGGQ